MRRSPSPSPATPTAAPPGRPLVDESRLAWIADEFGISVAALRATLQEAQRLDRRHAPLGELYAAIADDAPGWVRRKPEAVRRLLDGEPGAEHPTGGELPAVRGLGAVPYDEITVVRLERLVEETRQRVALQRQCDARAAGRPSRGHEKNLGNGAARNVAEVTRWICRALSADKDIGWNPAAELTFRRRKETVTGFTPEEEVRMRAVIVAKRRDSLLDLTVLDVALETGARKSAMIDLTVRDLSVVGCWARLYRKGGGTYRVPLRRSLVVRLLWFAWHRGARSVDDPVLLRIPGPDGSLRPLTPRYFDQLWAVVAAQMPDASERPFTHRLRHTAIDRVAHTCGFYASVDFAGHEPGDISHLGVHFRYVEPLSEQDLRSALERLFGPVEDIDVPPVTALPPFAPEPSTIARPRRPGPVGWVAHARRPG